jgi:hypothetical protein
VTGPGHEPDVDALRTDRYLESLLAAADRNARHAPADTAVDPRVRAVAARLHRDLVRVHPSFRFEERLALRLGEAAASMRLARAAGGEGSVRALVVSHSPDEAADAIPSHDDDGIRPLIIGGALTSAALSLAGAAYVAWRRARPGAAASPMVRAVRAARAARLRSAGARSGLD